jgi:Ras-related protein Rab-1A
MNDIKIAIVGPSGSGKTYFFNIVAQKNEKPKSTIGPMFCTRQFQLGSKTKNIKIIDTSGNQKFVNVTRTFLKGIDGVFVVFDLTDKNVFDKISDCIYELKRNQDAQIILVVNKKNQGIVREKEKESESESEISKKIAKK